MASSVSWSRSQLETVAAKARRVLVVCTANQCRSPMAAGLVAARLAREGLAERVTVASAGTWTTDGVPPTEHAVAAMAERGIDITAHRAREINAELINRADLILTMTDSHRIALETEFDGALGKTRLMSSLAGGGWDIADPVGGTLDDYRATCGELDRLVDAGWSVITGDSVAAGQAPAG